MADITYDALSESGQVSIEVNPAIVNPRTGMVITIHQQRWCMWTDGRTETLPNDPVCGECGVDHG